MKPILAVAAALVFAATITIAHAAPKGISAVEVASYKASVETGCRDQGRRLRHPWGQVEQRCNCVFETLNSRLTQEEWKRAAGFAQQRKEQDEAKVLAPHMAAVKRCEKNAARK